MGLKQTSRLYVYLGLLMVIVMAFTISCSSTSVGHTPPSKDDGEDYKELKGKTNQVKYKAAEMGKETRETSESWAGWAKEKISEGLGLKAEEAKETANKASDSATETAKKTKDKVEDMASG